MLEQYTFSLAARRFIWTIYDPSDFIDAMKEAEEEDVQVLNSDNLDVLGLGK
ncbi:unnamed protein product [Heterosigma akashiwo]